MDPLSVVVGHVVAQKPPVVTFAEDDDVIQKLTPAGSDPSFGERILPGTAIRRGYGFKAQVPDPGCDVGGEDRVALVDEKGKGGVRGECLPQLLDRPAGRWTRRDVEVDQSSPIMVEDEPDVQELEAYGRDDEEVYRRDGILVIPQERQPGA